MVDEVFRFLLCFRTVFALNFLYNGLFFDLGINSYRMVSFVLRQHTLEVLTVLCTEDRISKRRVTQLNFSVRNLLHTESGIVQIYCVTDLIVPCWIAFFIFLMVISHLLITCVGQVIKVQIIQFYLNQLFQRFILSGFNQNVMQIAFNAKIYQIGVCLNTNFFICDSGVTDTNGSKIAEISTCTELSLTVIVNQFLCQFQFCVDFFFGSFDCPSFGFFLRSKITPFLHQRINSLCHLSPGHLHIIATTFVITDTLGIVILTTMGCTGTGMGMTTCAKLIF